MANDKSEQSPDVFAAEPPAQKAQPAKIPTPIKPPVGEKPKRGDQNSVIHVVYLPGKDMPQGVSLVLPTLDLTIKALEPLPCNVALAAFISSKSRDLHILEVSMDEMKARKASLKDLHPDLEGIQPYSPDELMRWPNRNREFLEAYGLPIPQALIVEEQMREAAEEAARRAAEEPEILPLTSKTFEKMMKEGK